MKHSAFNAWKMLVMALPKGIASFVVVVAGLAISLPLSVFIVGLPLLTLTLVLCRRMMESENEYAERWIRGIQHNQPAIGSMKSPEKRHGWKSFLSVLGQKRSYRGLIYSFLQFPIGIAAFTVAIVLPATVLALMLSPLAYEVSLRMYDFVLFSNPRVFSGMLPNLEPYQLSWVVGGFGVLFALLLPLTLRVLGRFYTSWLQEITGAELLQSDERSAKALEYEDMPQAENVDTNPLRLVSGLKDGRPDPKDKATRAEMMQLISKL
ncbi:sensor domain-containing protein [Paenibacillus solisilvae]|uniref:Sensor domain-containing protein n=1 Tax=Paenibacillus solisilvae TaxID=2486751 RepID=A0ABW0VZ38_9BACL